MSKTSFYLFLNLALKTKKSRKKLRNRHFSKSKNTISGKMLFVFLNLNFQLVAFLGGCCVLTDAKTSNFSKPNFYGIFVFSKNTFFTLFQKTLVFRKPSLCTSFQQKPFLENCLTTVSRNRNTQH